jgi:hypothetical protein
MLLRAEWIALVGSDQHAPEPSDSLGALDLCPVVPPGRKGEKLQYDRLTGNDPEVISACRPTTGNHLNSPRYSSTISFEPGNVGYCVKTSKSSPPN